MYPAGLQTLLISALIAIGSLACTQAEVTVVATPTSDLGATVEAAVIRALPTETPTPTPNIDATVQARMAATLTAAPTPMPTPTLTPMPTPTLTHTPIPTVTPTPTPRPTATRRPTYTPQPTYTPIPTYTPRPTATPLPTATPRPTPTPDGSLALNEMIKQVRPAVVRVSHADGSGTGFMFETEGRNAYVMTNEHVIDQAGRITVTVNDSTQYNAMLVGQDAIRDLAVLRICCGSFSTLSFGNEADLEPGTEVVNIGYALGLAGEATVTTGIISAVRYDSSRSRWVVQTDAATNPGNSGGPMLSKAGKILGVNTYKIDTAQSGRDAEALGFAVSVRTVQDRLPRLKQGGSSPTPTPAPRPSPTPSSGGSSDFGPITGQLEHDPSDGFIKTEYAGVSMADMVVEATFFNPYAASSGSWDYGFILRQDRYDENDSFIQVVITSRRGWAVLVGSNTPYERVGGGTVNSLDTSPGGNNHLRVVTIGERGWLFVNGDFISVLNLGAVTKPGDIAVITGANSGDEVAGETTRFENFRGDRLTKRYGPTSGTLHKEPGSRSIGAHQSGLSARDLVMEAEFVNPQVDEWSYGFLIRHPKSNRLEVIGLGDQGRWFHYTRNPNDNDYTNKDSGYLSETGAKVLAQNRLMVLAFGSEGWFIVNGRLVAHLDLSHNLNSGGISVMGDFLFRHNGSPRFEGFTVWTP